MQKSKAKTKEKTKEKTKASAEKSKAVVGEKTPKKKVKAKVKKAARLRNLAKEARPSLAGSVASLMSHGSTVGSDVEVESAELTPKELEDDVQIPQSLYVWKPVWNRAISRINVITALRANTPEQKEALQRFLVELPTTGEEPALEYLREHPKLKVNLTHPEHGTPLQMAAKTGAVEMVTLLIERGARINAKHPVTGETPLHLAAIGGHAQVCTLLLSSGADINSREFEKRTPLHLAASRDHSETVSLLLASGAVVDAHDDFRRTPLHLAANIYVAGDLIRARADPKARDDEGATPLHHCVASGHTDVAELLFHMHANVNDTNNKGETALHLAALSEPDIVQLLLDHKANVNAESSNGRTPLQVAASVGGDKVLNILLDHGAIVDVRKTVELLDSALENGHTETGNLILKRVGLLADAWDGSSPLHWAAWGGFSSAAQFLIDHGGIFVDSKDREGHTPLMQAGVAGQTHVAKVLVEKGAKLGARDKLGETSLHKACHKGHLDVAEALLLSNADPMLLDKEGWTPLHHAALSGSAACLALLVRKGGDPNVPGKSELAPLHCAAERGFREATKVLLRGPPKADINARNINGATALQLAVTARQIRTATFLLEQGADLHFQADSDDGSLLHLAVTLGDEGILELLLKSGLRVDATDKNGCSPLHLSALSGAAEMTSLLLEYGSDPTETTSDSLGGRYIPQQGVMSSIRTDHTNEGAQPQYQKVIAGKTALHLAATAGHLDVMRTLIDQAAAKIVNVRDANGATPLHEAAQSQSEESVRVLLESGADVDALDDSQRTPLHFASRCGFKPGVKLLLQEEANVNCQDNVKATPLHMAMQKNHSSVTKVLLKHGADVTLHMLRQEASLLHYAVASGSVMNTELLLTSGVDVNVGDVVTKQTPLHIAAKMGHTAILGRLLEANASPSARDRTGAHPLHVAAQFAHTEVVQVLLAHGANPNAVNDFKSKDTNFDPKFLRQDDAELENSTPLHWIAYHADSPEYVDTARCLLEKGANVFAKEGENRFALTLVLANKDIDVREGLVPLLLTKMGSRVNNTPICFDVESVDQLLELTNPQVLVHIIGNPLINILDAVHGCRRFLETDQLRTHHNTVEAHIRRLEELAVMLLQGYNVTNGDVNELLDRKYRLPGSKREVTLIEHAIELEMKTFIAEPNSQNWVNKERTWGQRMLFLTTFPYIVLLTLLWMTALEPSRREPQPLEYILLLSTIGVVYDESMQLLRAKAMQRLEKHVKSVWNWINASILLLLFLVTICRILVGALPDSSFTDSMLIGADLLQGLATTTAFLRLTQLMVLSATLGPLLISVGYMMRDMMVFLLVFSVFMASFTVGLTKMFKNGGIAVDDLTYSTAARTFKNLFFALFGRFNLEDFDIGPEWQTLFLESIFGLFLVVCVIVLLNLLIAIMSLSYENVSGEADAEWKYSRTTVIMEMSQTGTFITTAADKHNHQLTKYIFLSAHLLPAPLSVLGGCCLFIHYLWFRLTRQPTSEIIQRHPVAQHNFGIELGFSFEAMNPRRDNSTADLNASKALPGQTHLDQLLSPQGKPPGGLSPTEKRGRRASIDGRRGGTEMLLPVDELRFSAETFWDGPTGDSLYNEQNRKAMRTGAMVTAIQMSTALHELQSNLQKSIQGLATELSARDAKMELLEHTLSDFRTVIAGGGPMLDTLVSMGAVPGRQLQRADSKGVKGLLRTQSSSKLSAATLTDTPGPLKSVIAKDSLETRSSAGPNPELANAVKQITNVMRRLEDVSGRFEEMFDEFSASTVPLKEYLVSSVHPAVAVHDEPTTHFAVHVSDFTTTKPDGFRIETGLSSGIEMASRGPARAMQVASRNPASPVQPGPSRNDIETEQKGSYQPEIPPVESVQPEMPPVDSVQPEIPLVASVPPVDAVQPEIPPRRPPVLDQSKPDADPHSFEPIATGDSAPPPQPSKASSRPASASDQPASSTDATGTARQVNAATSVLSAAVSVNASPLHKAVLPTIIPARVPTPEALPDEKPTSRPGSSSSGRRSVNSREGRLAPLPVAPSPQDSAAEPVAVKNMEIPRNLLPPIAPAMKQQPANSKPLDPVVKPTPKDESAEGKMKADDTVTEERLKNEQVKTQGKTDGTRKDESQPGDRAPASQAESAKAVDTQATSAERNDKTQKGRPPIASYKIPIARPSAEQLSHMGNSRTEPEPAAVKVETEHHVAEQVKVSGGTEAGARIAAATAEIAEPPSPKSPDSPGLVLPSAVPLVADSPSPGSGSPSAPGDARDKVRELVAQATSLKRKANEAKSNGDDAQFRGFTVKSLEKASLAFAIEAKVLASELNTIKDSGDVARISEMEGKLRKVFDEARRTAALAKQISAGGVVPPSPVQPSASPPPVAPPAMVLSAAANETPPSAQDAAVTQDRPPPALVLRAGAAARAASERLTQVRATARTSSERVDVSADVSQEIRPFLQLPTIEQRQHQRQELRLQRMQGSVDSDEPASSFDSSGLSHGAAARAKYAQMTRRIDADKIAKGQGGRI